MNRAPPAVVWSETVERDLARLQPQIGERIVGAIERYALNGAGDVTRLRGSTEEYRLRVGDWRVRFVDEPKRHRLIVLRVLPRGRAYRD